MNTPTGSPGSANADRANAGAGNSGPDALLLVLAAVVLCYVWRLQDLFSIVGSLQIPLLSAGLAAAVYVLNDHPRRRLGEVDGPILRLLGGLAAIMVMGAPFAIIQSQTFTFFTRDFLPSIVLLTGLTAAAVRSEEDVRWLAGVHVAGAALFCLVVLGRYSVGASGRLGDLVYYDANDLGMLLVMTFPMGLFFLLRGRDLRVRLMSAAALLLFIVVIIKTGSRGAFVGFCIVGLWILVRYTAIPTGRRLAALAAAVVLLGVWGSSDYWNRMETLLSPTEDYNWAGESESGRMEVWKRGVGYMFSHPLVGVGARNFSAAEGYLSRGGQLNQLGAEGFKWSAAHNSFVEIGAETGVIGLLLFLALLFQGFRISGRSPPAPSSDTTPQDSEALRQALRVSLVGYMATGFFLSAAYDPILFAMLGLLAGIAKLDRQASERLATGVANGGPLRAAGGVYRLVRRGDRRRAS